MCVCLYIHIYIIYACVVRIYIYIVTPDAMGAERRDIKACIKYTCIYIHICSYLRVFICAIHLEDRAKLAEMHETIH